MATVFIPPQLRDLTGGAAQAEVAAGSLRNVIAQLEAQHPGIAARLADGDHLAAGLAVSIDGVMTTRGLLEKIDPESEVHFLPAIGGG
jgi:molybdopterin synthase sulfur carrier subunit